MAVAPEELGAGDDWGAACDGDAAAAFGELYRRHLPALLRRLATPIRAVAAASCASASRTSARRSRRLDGSPAGTAGAAICASSGRPRATASGLRPSRMLITFSVCSICRSMSGTVSAAPATRISAWRTSIMLATPPSWRRTTSPNDRWREASVLREISSCWSSARSWKYAEATSDTSVVMTKRRASSVENRSARAASVVRR